MVANVAFMRASQFGEAVQSEVRSFIAFFDLASACIWLGVDLEALQPVVESLRIEARSHDDERAD
jgi:hypothetical protein